jgi:hypothetical protein
LNCLAALSSPEIINDTLPTSLSSGPHKTTLPVFKLMELISLASIGRDLSLHDISTVQMITRTTVAFCLSLFMIVIGLNGLL